MTYEGIGIGIYTNEKAPRVPWVRIYVTVAAAAWTRMVERSERQRNTQV